jgi:hypothetical protein
MVGRESPGVPEEGPRTVPSPPPENPRSTLPTVFQGTREPQVKPADRFWHKHAPPLRGGHTNERTRSGPLDPDGQRRL